MHDLAFATETLKQEHRQRMQEIQHDRLARQMATHHRRPHALRNWFGDLLILAGERLRIYGGETVRPFDEADSGFAS